MAGLYWKVKSYLETNSKTVSEFESNIVLQNDGSGDYIKTWNVDGLSKPTDSQLTSADTQGTKDYNNNRIKKTRKKSYGDIGEQLDEIYKDIDAWKARIKSIKDDNPKE
jgi:hypothetical protein|tara:strand:+ start:378 stop:704 length:327 start_codon:yes stop_codon:yes gene_type:complete